MPGRLLAVVVLLAARGLILLAQSVPAPPGPNASTFEVASVKSNATATRSLIRTEPGGRFTVIDSIEQPSPD